MARIKLELPEVFPFSTEIDIRITDVNYGQHVGNDAMLSLIQEARVRFLRRHGMSEIDVGGCGMIMVDAVLILQAEVFYGDTLVVEMAVRDVSRCGCDFLYRMTKKGTGEHVAKAKTGIACFDYAARKMVRLSDKLRALADL